MGNIAVSIGTHVPVPCIGINQDGTCCRRFRWMPKDQAPAAWCCHDHQDFTR